MTYQILLADDDRTFGAILKKKLDSENFNVMLAFDGKSALRKVNDYRFDACILDINMPHLNGYELCSLLRNHQDFKEIPIFLSHEAYEQVNISKLKRSGATETIIKPFSRTKLLDAIFKYIQ